MEEGNAATDAGQFAAQVIQAISAESMQHDQDVHDADQLTHNLSQVPDGLIADAIPVDPDQIATVPTDENDLGDDSPHKGRKDEIKNKRCMLCGMPISSRLYCWKCYKRKQRGKDKDIQPGQIIKRGRPHKPIAEHSKPAAKFKKLEEHVEKWIGTREEATKILDEYVKKRAKEMKEGEPEEYQIYKKIGMSICELLKDLPPTSPFRKPLLHSITKKDDVKPKDLKKVLPFSNGLYHSSKHLSDRDNIFLILRSLPAAIRERLQKEGVLEEPIAPPPQIAPPNFGQLMDAIPMVPTDLDNQAGMNSAISGLSSFNFEAFPMNFTTSQVQLQHHQLHQQIQSIQLPPQQISQQFKQVQNPSQDVG